MNHHGHHASPPCHCAFAHLGCYTCPPLVHPMRCHRSPPIVCSCLMVPMKCHPFSTIDHSKKRKGESILLKPATYHITVRPLNPMSNDSTADQRSETRHVPENEDFDVETDHLPTVPCRKIISKRNQVHVSSTSFLFTTNDPVKSLVDARRANENIEQIDSTKRTRLSFDNKKTRPLEQQNTKADDSANTRTAEKIDDNERRDDSVIELSSNDVSIQSDVVRTVPNQGHSKTEKSPDQLNESVHPPSSSPPDINRIKSNEIAPRRMRSLTSLVRDRPKSITDIRRSNGSLGKARSTIDFGFLIDEVIAPHDKINAALAD